MIPPFLSIFMTNTNKDMLNVMQTWRKIMPLCIIIDGLRSEHHLRLFKSVTLLIQAYVMDMTYAVLL